MSQEHSNAPAQDNCRLLTAYLEDRLRPELHLIFESHVEGCPACQQALEEIAADTEIDALLLHASQQISLPEQTELPDAVPTPDPPVTPAQPPEKRTRYAWAYAASIALLLLLCSVTLRNWFAPFEQTETAQQDQPIERKHGDIQLLAGSTKTDESAASTQAENQAFSTALIASDQYLVAEHRSADDSHDSEEVPFFWVIPTTEAN